MTVSGSSTRQLLLATANDHKAREIVELLGDVPFQIVTPRDLQLDVDVVEGGDTYEANALLKARAAVGASSLAAIADDSGLEVSVLDGAPGIRSARFAGEEATDEEKNLLLLNQMQDVPESDRGARYVCVAVLVDPTVKDEETRFRGEWEGSISFAPEGEEGFGFDPVFVIVEEGQTVAQLGAEYKKAHSHRSKAFRQLADHLRGL